MWAQGSFGSKGGDAWPLWWWWWRFYWFSSLGVWVLGSGVTLTGVGYLWNWRRCSTHSTFPVVLVKQQLIIKAIAVGFFSYWPHRVLVTVLSLHRNEDLKEMLESNKESLKLEAMKRVIGVSAWQDVSFYIHRFSGFFSAGALKLPFISSWSPKGKMHRSCSLLWWRTSPAKTSRYGIYETSERASFPVIHLCGSSLSVNSHRGNYLLWKHNTCSTPHI